MYLLPCAHCGSSAVTPWEIRFPGGPRWFTCCSKTCTGATTIPIEVWQTRAPVLGQAVGSALQSMLELYEDVRTLATHLRSENAWGVLQHHAKVLRQALQAASEETSHE